MYTPLTDFTPFPRSPMEMLFTEKRCDRHRQLTAQYCKLYALYLTNKTAILCHWFFFIYFFNAIYTSAVVRETR